MLERRDGGRDKEKGEGIGISIGLEIGVEKKRREKGYR